MLCQPKPNKRQLQYQNTLENIRTAVDKLVEQKGFEAMTVRDICEEAGIKTGGFYHHFSSKDELLFDRYHRMNRYFTDFDRTELSDKGSIEGLLLLTDTFFAYLKSRVTSMMIQYNKSFVMNQVAWEQKEPDACVAISLRLLEDGQRSGELQSAYSADALNQYLWCLIRGAVQCYCASNGAFLEETPLEQMLREWIISLKDPQDKR